MASIVNRPNGRREVQFTDANGKRQTVRLGKMPKRAAESIKTRIELLLTSRISKEPIDNETAKWVGGLDDVLSDRLARLGLIRRRESTLLDDFLKAYIEGRTDVQPRTALKYEAAKSHLVDFFKASRNVRNISAGDADDWRVYLIGKGIGENTVRKYSQIAKQFFNAAIKRELTEANPFADLKSTVQGNPERAVEQLAEMDSYFSRKGNKRHRVVCGHAPLFLNSADEPDEYFNVPGEYRKKILAVMKKHGVDTYLCGHTHRDLVATDPCGVTVYAQTALSFQLAKGARPGYYLFTVGPEEIAREMELPAEAVRSMMDASQHAIALERPVGDDGDSEFGDFIEDQDTPSPLESATQHLLQETIEEVLGELTPRQSHILRLRFGLGGGEPHTLEEIANKFGLSRERIRQLEKEALRRLRHPKLAHNLRDYLS